MSSFKKLIGVLIILAALLFYAHGFLSMRILDIVIPAGFLSMCGFIFLGGIWLIRYSDKKGISHEEK